jgi:hypothetical protein
MGWLSDAFEPRTTCFRGGASARDSQLMEEDLSAVEQSVVKWLQDNALFEIIRCVNAPDYSKTEYKHISVDVDFCNLLNENSMDLRLATLDLHCSAIWELVLCKDVQILLTSRLYSTHPFSVQQLLAKGNAFSFLCLFQLIL